MQCWAISALQPFYCLQLVVPENTICTHNKNLQLLLSKLASFSCKSQCLDRREPRCRRAPKAQGPRCAATAQPGACIATITIPDASNLEPATLCNLATLCDSAPTPFQRSTVGRPCYLRTPTRGISSQSSSHTLALRRAATQPELPRSNQGLRPAFATT